MSVCAVRAVLSAAARNLEWSFCWLVLDRAPSHASGGLNSSWLVKTCVYRDARAVCV